MTRLPFIISVFFTSIAFAQKPKLIGIGKFQIGKTTTSIIGDLAKEYNIPIKETNDDLATIDEFNYNGLSKILYISRDANEGKLMTHFKYVEHPLVKVYYLNNITIADLNFHDVWLKFYKDTLYYINTDRDEYIDSALTLKYGSPKLSKETKQISCSNAYRDFSHKEWTYYRTWSPLNSAICAYTTTGQYYDRDCKQQPIDYLMIYNTRKERLIEDQIAKAAKEAQTERDKERSKALSDL